MDNRQFLAQYYEKKAARRTGFNIAIGVLTVPVLALLAQVITIYVPGFLNLYRNDSMVRLLYSTVITVVGFILGGTVLNALEKTKANEVLVKKEISAKNAVLLLFMGLAVCTVGNMASNILSNAFKNTIFEPKGVSMDIPGGISGRIVYIICSAAIPALTEEFLYRGAVFTAAKKFSKNAAIIVSSVLFALMHGNLSQIPFAFIVGLFLGFAVAETENIFIAVLIHFTNNFISCFFAVYENQIPDYLLNIINISMFILTIAAGLICAAIYFKSNKNVAGYKDTPHSISQNQRIKSILLSPLMFVFYAYEAYSIILCQIMY